MSDFKEILISVYDFLTNPITRHWIGLFTFFNMVGGILAMVSHATMIAIIIKKIHPNNFANMFKKVITKQFKNYPKLFFCSWVSFYWVIADYKALSRSIIQGVVLRRQKNVKGYSKGKGKNKGNNKSRKRWR